MNNNISNPFEALDKRLLSIECLLMDIKHKHSEKKESAHADLPENLTRKQTSSILNVCLSKVDQLANEGRLTKYRNGSVVRFKKSEVLNFYKSFAKYQRH